MEHVENSHMMLAAHDAMAPAASASSESPYDAGAQYSAMRDSTQIRTLNCSLKPENPSWAYRCGVFFDVVNKSEGPILLTGLAAGSHSGDKEATLYACTEGASTGHETDASAWKILWEGILKQRSSTSVPLNVALKVAPQATQGLLLVSKAYAVYHTINEGDVEDEHIKICAGVRSTEHRGEKNPFDPSAHDPRMKATHAGSVSYILGTTYIVMLLATAPDDEGLLDITCCNTAGAEIVVLQVRTTDDVSTLRPMIAAALSSEEVTSEAIIELMAPDGTLLSDGVALSTALFPC
jgi:hypothetical protein